MARFYDLLEKSTILQGLVTVGVVGVICYKVACGSTVPPEFYAFGGLILGYFFGSKTQQEINRAVTRGGR